MPNAALSEAIKEAIRPRTNDSNHWASQFGPRPDEHLSAWLTDQFERLHQRHTVNFADLVGQFAAFGLSQEWDQAVLGMSPAISVDQEH